MTSYVYPENSLPLLTNPALKTEAELELGNFRVGETMVGLNTYRIIRTNFVIDDEISLRVKQNSIKSAQARLLISRQLGISNVTPASLREFEIQRGRRITLSDFRNITQRQMTLIQTYLRENQIWS